MVSLEAKIKTGGRIASLPSVVPSLLISQMVGCGLLLEFT